MKDKKVIHFYNEELQKIIDKYITEYRYGDYVEVLSEIFQRRAKEFDYTNKEMEAQLKTFVKRVEKIEIIPKDFFEGKNASAWYLAERKKIELSDELFSIYDKRFNGDRFKIGEEFYAVLSHEVYHAISHRKENEMGLAMKIPFQREPSNTVMNEAFTEVAASRTVYKRDKINFDTGKNQVSGYNEITFAPMMLASAIGVTEKEMLKAGMNGNDSLEKLMFSKYPKEDKEIVKNLLGKVELYLQALYKIASREAFMKSEKGKRLLKYQLVEITKSVYGLSYLQMSKDKRNIDGNLIGEMEFRNSVITRLLGNTRDYFLDRGALTEDDIKQIYDEVEASGDIGIKSVDLVAQAEIVLYFKQKGISPEIISKMQVWAKKGELRDNKDKLLQENGIDIQEYFEFRKKYWKDNGKQFRFDGQDDYKDKIKKSDYHDFAEWDNEEISRKTLELMESENKKFNFRKIEVIGKRLINKTKGILKKIFTKRNILLEGNGDNFYNEDEVGYKSDVSGFDDIKVKNIRYNPQKESRDKNLKSGEIQIEEDVK